MASVRRDSALASSPLSAAFTASTSRLLARFTSSLSISTTSPFSHCSSYYTNKKQSLQLNQPLQLLIIQNSLNSSFSHYSSHQQEITLLESQLNKITSTLLPIGSSGLKIASRTLSSAVLGPLLLWAIIKAQLTTCFPFQNSGVPLLEHTYCELWTRIVCFNWKQWRMGNSTSNAVAERLDHAGKTGVLSLKELKLEEVSYMLECVL